MCGLAGQNGHQKFQDYTLMSCHVFLTSASPDIQIARLEFTKWPRQEDMSLRSHALETTPRREGSKERRRPDAQTQGLQDKDTKTRSYDDSKTRGDTKIGKHNASETRSHADPKTRRHEDAKTPRPEDQKTTRHEDAKTFSEEASFLMVEASKGPMAPGFPT